ncbi:MAG: hypothetical protein DI586_00875 [Micavibrio aeruginosavorus]|uniref:Lipoprotein n=1 Tax=Micavibrio aeruginosavorus TaxID=349221 RepID=A0A2W5FS48_9BACT|nr:MAG: hypothetical protein DI586_00875 [Micavibrio aeruginosavorus]
MNFKIIFLAILTLASCSTVIPSYENWMGEWTGPEGTSLIITNLGQEEYQIVIKDLDGSKYFRGHATDRGIVFTRRGKDELIRHGSGTDTGMKWLLDKKNCLMIKVGEGFCRN